MKYRIVCIATASMLTILLAGCSTFGWITGSMGTSKPELCPDAMILAGTSSLPAFDPAQVGDPSGVIYSIAMTNVTTQCSYEKSEKTADSSLKIFFHAQRPPGGREVKYRIPYYVALTTNGVIFNKQILWFEFTFPEGAVSRDAEEDVDSVMVKFERDKTGYDYHYIVGFQLTKTQLDYNAKIGPYEP